MFFKQLKIALVGYGNPLRGDDGAGIETAKITKELAKGLPVVLFEYQQLTIDLASTLKDFDKIVFFDCSVEVDYGGYLISLIRPTPAPMTLSHHIKPSDLLLCIKTLYGNEPEGFLCQIGGRDFEFGSGLNEDVLRAVHECAKETAGILLKGSGREITTEALGHREK